MLPIVLILAAGSSTRFRAAGGNNNKLDAQLITNSGNLTVLEHVIAAAQASGLPWHVVTSQHTSHMAQQGMGTSIATGVKATTYAPGWLILPGDMPLVQPESIRCIASELSSHSVVAPLVHHKQGHPVGFSSIWRHDLEALNGDQGARSILSKQKPFHLQLDDIGCTFDVDTPELLERAKLIATKPKGSLPVFSDQGADLI